MIQIISMLSVCMLVGCSTDIIEVGRVVPQEIKEQKPQPNIKIPIPKKRPRSLLRNIDELNNEDAEQEPDEKEKRQW